MISTSRFPFPVGARILPWLLCASVSSTSEAQVPLRERIGQMVMVTATGDSLEAHTPSMDTLRSDLAGGLIGGLVMFNWSGNLESPGQIAHLTAELQKSAGIPLLLAIDQEGGRVARLGRSNGFASTPSAAAMGMAKSEQYTRSVAAEMAGWFVQTGLNLNLAPVVDVNVNPFSPAIGAKERSFSADPDSVALQAGWFIDEFRKRGILTLLKHYPGHGSAAGDSHLGFTDVTDTWTPMELTPYAALLSTRSADAVMTAHVFNAALDSLRPATLSPPTISGLLRRQLGFGGVVATDAMSMQAITLQFGFEEAMVLAVNAGVDILLYTANLDSAGRSLARKVVDHLEACVGEGTIPVSRIDESYARIMELKGRLPTAVPGALAEVHPARIDVGNYPNPFNSSTTVVTHLSLGGRLVQEIFDPLGRRVASLFEGERGAGEFAAVWDGRGEGGAVLASGVYFCRTRIFDEKGRVEGNVRRMLLLR